MSTKFEQLLDYLVNEEMDKANELFHEIVVEKSREIYENMIAEEAEEEMDESMDDDEVDESMDDEAVEEETTLEIGGDATDDFMSGVADDSMDGDVGSDDGMDDMGDMDGDLGAEGEGSEEERISDLEDALEELKAEFEALMAGEEEEPEHDDMFGGDEEGDEEGDMDDEEGDIDDEEGDEETKEGRMFTREYVEKVADGHGVEKKGKAEAADNTRSPVSSAKGRPTTSATAHNILGGKGGNEAGIKGGEGLVGSVKGQFTKGVEKNISGSSKSSFGNGSALSKNAAGHGAERKGGTPGPVGSGSGDKAGQTSVGVVKSPLNGAPSRNA
jgi:hypothetical protein